MDDKKLVGEIIGYIGGFFIFASFLVQIIKMLRLKSFKELSYIFVIIQALVCILFIVYGVLDDLKPIYISNIAICVELVTATILKYIYDKKSSKHIENNKSNKVELVEL